MGLAAARFAHPIVDGEEVPKEIEVTRDEDDDVQLLSLERDARDTPRRVKLPEHHDKGEEVAHIASDTEKVLRASEGTSNP